MVATTKITGAGKSVDAVVSRSTRCDVAWYSCCASGRIFDCINPDASDRYDDPTGLPARLLVRAISISPVYTASSALIRPSNCTSASSVSPLDALGHRHRGFGDRLLVALPDRRGSGWAMNAVAAAASATDSVV